MSALLAFEVFGKVQGVWFRKYTKKCADSLGLSGWVMNTDRGTVVGEAAGSERAIEAFRTFLETEGSPRSRIDRAEFSTPASIRRTDGFEVIR